MSAPEHLRLTFIALPHSSLPLNSDQKFGQNVSKYDHSCEEEVQNQMVGCQQFIVREEAPQKREVRVDISTNDATDQPNEVPFNFPPKYDSKDAP